LSVSDSSSSSTSWRLAWSSRRSFWIFSSRIALFSARPARRRNQRSCLGQQALRLLVVRVEAEGRSRVRLGPRGLLGGRSPARRLPAGGEERQHRLLALDLDRLELLGAKSGEPLLGFVKERRRVLPRPDLPADERADDVDAVEARDGVTGIQ